MQKVLVYEFQLSFPMCEHKEQYSARSKHSAQDLAKNLIEKQNGLCGKCYKRYCNEHDLVPWYSK